ncbi:MAG: transcriptional regulator [Planctomycetota bacterium]|nr:MAG: transcriptional regulator [Planctomycetota bacterium]
MSSRKTVVFGFLGSKLDRGGGPERWGRWRPSISLLQHEELLVDRFELLHGGPERGLAEQFVEDAAKVSPETRVQTRAHGIAQPWNIEEVFEALLDLCERYSFDTEHEDYLVHISTGTHVQQICLFLLTESRHFPARLLQSSPPRKKQEQPGGCYSIIDLDLSRYSAIAARFAREQQQGASLLKSGIETRNESFNQQIDEIEFVAGQSEAPILLTGPTGVGKSQLASRIYEFKRQRRQVAGDFVEVNCATLRGDQAMSALFGHVAGAFTGAERAREGLLRRADAGLLFLDEIGELGIDEQAMMLRAIEERRFLPIGSDVEVESEFQLIAGTNRDLVAEVQEGRFRGDLLARINMWTFELPSLLERLEDLEPNLDYELARHTERSGRRVSFEREARERYLSFARGPEAKWSGNFRDLNASLTRLCTLAAGGRIDVATVELELGRLRRAWRGAPSSGSGDEELLRQKLGVEQLEDLDLFDRAQLAEVLRVCAKCRSLSEAGRTLFQASRLRKKSGNDADRLRKYLARFGLDFAAL